MSNFNLYDGVADPYTGMRSEEMTQKNKRIQELEKENRELKRQLDSRCDNVPFLKMDHDIECIELANFS